LYGRPNLDNEKEFKTIISAWGLIVKEMALQSPKIDKSLVVNLFVFLYEIYHNSGRKINEKTVGEFSKVYLELEGKRLLEIDSWKNNLRYANKKLKEKSDRILTDFIPYVDEFFIKLDSKRLFNIDDKINLYKKSNGIVRRLDGTEVHLTVLQALNGDFIHADHIDPYSLGGETSLENGQLLLKEDNLKKSDS
jgi:CRISPR/Cas system Type II protein with McrA/HNH and RuvC-like nuclease domain